MYIIMPSPHSHEQNTNKNLDQRRHISIAANRGINKAMGESYYWHPDHEEQTRTKTPEQRPWRDIGGDRGEIFVVAEREAGLSRAIKDVVL